MADWSGGHHRYRLGLFSLPVTSFGPSSPSVPQVVPSRVRITPVDERTSSPARISCHPTHENENVVA
uniref:Uncharacterized protein n=1 Tax=Anopheles coluzzii TaxID=1518534 RepID=A0A8W7PU50_ANOCL